MQSKIMRLFLNSDYLEAFGEESLFKLFHHYLPKFMSKERMIWKGHDEK